MVIDSAAAQEAADVFQRGNREAVEEGRRKNSPADRVASRFRERI
jgi:hypothetical protein